jgi:hypothetical protein
MSSTDPLQLRAGDLTAEHIGHDAGDGPIMAIHHYIEAGKHSVDIISVRGVRQWHSAKILTLSPPAPIRRRITWADLQDTTPRQWEGADVVANSWADRTTAEPLSGWLQRLISNVVWWVVIEVPQGHALAECGEAVT